MADKKGVGSPLDVGVSEQLEVRSRVISSQDRAKNTLLFLNANKPWIKLSSGVNTLSDVEIEALETSNRTQPQAGDSSLAKKHTLGLLKTTGGISKEVYTPVTLSEKGAINDSQSITNATYRNYASIGYKPEPGITSATVRSKGSYGVLRETTVEFTVWTLEDLNLVEALYLRPGYTMLLEWGHSLYFANDGSFQTIPFQFGDDFFNSKSDSKVEAKIEELRVKSGYNYDAIYGYVKNFSWDFKKTGGYGCTITIASKGTVIESLRVDRSPMDFIPASELLRPQVEDYREQQKSIFHYFLSRLNLVKIIEVRNRRGYEVTKLSKERLLNARVPKYVENRFGRVDRFGDQPAMSTFLTPLQDFNIYSYTFDTPFFGEDSKVKYIPLSLVLDIINNYLGRTKDGVQKLQFYTGQDTALGSDRYEVDCKFVTSKYHFALDPTVCLLAKTPKVPVEIGTELGDTPIPNLTQIATSGQNSSKFEHLKGQDDDILNIYVTDVMLKPIVDSFIDAEQSRERNILAFVEAILSKINDNLGGVNELSLNEESGVYYVVDRKLTPKVSTSYPELNLAGLKTTVTDLHISSKLSNQVGSQIAIAAQGIDSNYNENISELLTWNLGLVDRFSKATEQTTPSFPSEAPAQFYTPPGSSTGGSRSTNDIKESEKLQTWAKDLKELYNKFYTKDYDDVSFDELKTYHRDYTAKYVLSYQTALEEPEKGIIPVELSFTLLGISGITIAKAFKIAEGILPTKYSKKFGFIITGLEHEIGSQWLTKVKTQFYVLEQPSQVRVKAAISQFGTTTQSGTENNNAPQLVTAFGGLTPQADRVRVVLPLLGYSERYYQRLNGRKGELSSGGDLDPKMADTAITLLQQIKGQALDITLELTAGNDIYHQNRASKHNTGRAIDFKIYPQNVKNLQRINKLLSNLQKELGTFTYLDEYAKPSPNSTGGHFHIQLK